MNPLKSKLVLSLFAFVVLAISSAQTAKADFLVVAVGGGTGTNIQFNDDLPQSGTTVQALDNTNAFRATFTSSSGNLQANGGQAAIGPGAGNSNFNSLTITLDNNNATFTDAAIAQAIFNINNPNNIDATATFTATLLEPNGTTITQTFATTFTLGNGSNFFTVTPTNGEQILSLTINTSVGVIDIRQIRLLGANLVPPTPPTAVPEPATMALLGTGLAGVAAKVRRRRKE